MKLILNAFILSLVLFVSLSSGNLFLMMLYLGLQMSKTMENRLEIMDKSIAVMDNFAIPTGII